jgi:uncharacterized protein (TIGR03086 family)
MAVSFLCVAGLSGAATMSVPTDRFSPHPAGADRSRRATEGAAVREQDVFVLADRALEHVVDQIRDDQWDMVMPAEFATARSGERVTLREIVNYHAYDDAWVPDMLAGATMDDVGADKFQGDLLGADPKQGFSALVDQAGAAAQALDDLERIVHCSFGDYPAREYFWQINGFRGLRAHDIAKVIGADTRLPDDLVQGLWEEIEPHAEEWREIGVFGPKVDVPADASLQDRLLGLTGRQPDA